MEDEKTQEESINKESIEKKENYFEDVAKMKGENKDNSSPENYPVKYYNNIGGDMNVFERSLEDPTFLYTPSNNLLEYSNETVINEQIKLLQETRIIILESYDMSVIEAVSDVLSKNEIFNSLEKRILRFSNHNVKRTDLSIEYFAKSNNKQIKDTLFFININNTSEEFSESFFSRESNYQNSFSKIYEERNIYIVCWVCLPEIIDKISKNCNNLCFPKTYIPFFSYSVNNFLGGGAAFWTESIRKQREKGLWGENHSELELYEQLESIKQDGKERFKEAVAKLNEGLSKEDEELRVFKKSVLTNKHPEDILKNAERICLHLTFIVTFFENLSLQEFIYLVGLLLEEKNEQKYPIWSLDKDHYIKKSFLRTFISEETNFQVVDFQRKSIRKEFKDFFEENFSSYVHDRFEYLFFGKIVLFNNNATPRIIDAVCSFFAYTAKNDPDFYIKKVLLSIARDFDKENKSNSDLEKMKEDASQNAAITNAEDFVKFINFIQKIDSLQKEKDVVFIRISSLIREATDAVHFSVSSKYPQ